MFRKRNHKFESSNDVWKEWKPFYDPVPFANESMFSALDDIPTVDDIRNALNTRKDSLAPGLSNIGYTLLKHLPDNILDALGSFFYLCVQSSKVPIQWKWASLYPIPKPKDWNYRISITRPILLLECTRKIMMKIFTTQLSDIML